MILVDNSSEKLKLLFNSHFRIRCIVPEVSASKIANITIKIANREIVYLKKFYTYKVDPTIIKLKLIELH